MNEQSPAPVLQLLDAEPAGFCAPDSDYCDVPDHQREAPERTDKTDTAREGDRS